MTQPITTFDSVAQAALACPPRGFNISNLEYWCRSLTHRQAVEYALNGDDSFVPKAEALLDKIQDATGNVQRDSWEPSPYGAYPVVPEFLAGTPECMRLRRTVEAECSPMTIWVDLACSHYVTTQAMEQRGIAILALLLKLQMVRPVDLVLLSSASRTNHGSDIYCRMAINVNSRPLDTATVGFALCHVGYARELLFSYAHAKLGVNPSIAYPVSSTDILRRWYDIPVTDLVIPGAHMRDELISRDPIAWVNAQLNTYGDVAQ